MYDCMIDFAVHGMRDPRPETSGVDPTSSSAEMNESAWDDSRIAAHQSSGGPRPQHQGGPVPPQRARDDAAVGYFYQRPDNDMTPDGGGQSGSKQRWAVGDDMVIDQVKVNFFFPVS